MEDQIKNPDALHQKSVKMAVTEKNSDVFPFSDKDALMAGMKIKNKGGGPVMLVIGFSGYYPSGKIINYNPEYLTCELYGYYGSYEITCHIYPIVRINNCGLPSKKFGLTEKEQDKVFKYLFFNSEFFEGNASYASNDLYLVCKRWSDKLEDFQYQIFNIHEVEKSLE